MGYYLYTFEIVENPFAQGPDVIEEEIVAEVIEVNENINANENINIEEDLLIENDNENVNDEESLLIDDRDVNFNENSNVNVSDTGERARVEYASCFFLVENSLNCDIKSLYYFNTAPGVAKVVLDTDGDNIRDSYEILISLDPNKEDTDGDGYSDYDEIMGGFSPYGEGPIKFKYKTVEEWMADYEDEIMEYEETTYDLE